MFFCGCSTLLARDASLLNKSIVPNASAFVRYKQWTLSFFRLPHRRFQRPRFGTVSLLFSCAVARARAESKIEVDATGLPGARQIEQNRHVSRFTVNFQLIRVKHLTGIEHYVSNRVPLKIVYNHRSTSIDSISIDIH